MTRQVLVPIADGCEEMEAVTIIDILRRAEITVTVASCQADGSLEITASRGVHLKADCHISACTDKAFHMIILPGGMPGAEHLRDCPHLTRLLKAQKKNKRWYAAICAAPAVVLSHHGLLDNVKATCYPGFIDRLEGAMPQLGDLVVIDQQKQVITAQGPGNAIDFSFKIIDRLYGKDSYRPVAKQLIAEWAL